jgi:predicted nucleic acid-binding protein
MASYYFDTSALAKRYIQENGSSWVSAICDDTENNLVFISELTEIELVSAIFRRAKGGSLTKASAQTEISNFDGDCQDQYFAVEVSRTVLSSARDIVERHSLRGYDAVQLAAAVECSREQDALGLPAICFVSADLELLAAAKAEGLQTENPNDHK